MQKKRMPGAMVASAMVAGALALSGVLEGQQARAKVADEDRVLVAKSRASAPLVPDASAVDARGRTWSLRSLRGRPVILTLFATWCPACRSEMNELDALQKKFGPKGLVILAVSTEDSSVLADFARSSGHAVPLLRGSEETMSTFALEAYPTTFFIGRDSRILARTVGASPDYTRLLAALTQAELAPSAASAASTPARTPSPRAGSRAGSKARRSAKAPARQARPAASGKPKVGSEDDGVVLLSNSGRRVIR